MTLRVRPTLFMINSALLRILFVALWATVAVWPTPVKVREPFITLPLARHFNATGPIPMAQKDHARIKALVQNAKGNVERRNTDAIDPVYQDFYYTVQMGISVPPTYYTLILDIGSSNTWVGARGFDYLPSSVYTGETVNVSWRSGTWSGKEYQDLITLHYPYYEYDGILQSFGVASEVQWDGFNVDGVLGLGPIDLTCGTLSSGNCIPTVSYNYYAQGYVDAPMIAIDLGSYDAVYGTSGLLVFGGTETSYPPPWNGTLPWVPITSTAPANKYVGIDQSITYGSSDTPILSLTAGMIDTATTLIYLATDAFEAYQAATGAVMDWSTFMLKITNEQYVNLQSLYFHIGDVTYEFTPNAQIWPRALNVAAGGEADAIYLPFGDLGTYSGEGLDFVNGMVWLQRYYLVYDAGNNRVGLAVTDKTYLSGN